MQVISKEIFNALMSPEVNCMKLLHPTTDSCLMAGFDSFIQGLIGSSKFYLVIYLLQTILKWKQVKKKNFIKQQIRAYIRSVIYGGLQTMLFISGNCVIRNCIKQYSFYTIDIPAIISGLSILAESEENCALNTVIYVNLVAETGIRYLYWSNIIKRTVLKETLMFMSCSSIIMYLLKSEKSRNNMKSLWFYYPPRTMAKTDNNLHCKHDDSISCYHYFYQGLRKYFLIAYSLQLLKYLLPRINKLIFTPRKIFNEAFSKDKFLSGFLIGSFVGIYRIVTCVLRKKDKEERHFHSLLAGFLAGTVYFLKPTLSLLAIALSTTLGILINRIDYIKNLEEKLPLRELTYLICNCILFHNRLFYPICCPNYIKTVWRVASNGRLQEFYETTTAILHSKILETGIITASKM